MAGRQALAPPSQRNPAITLPKPGTTAGAHLHSSSMFTPDSNSSWEG